MLGGPTWFECWGAHDCFVESGAQAESWNVSMFRLHIIGTWY